MEQNTTAAKAIAASLTGFAGSTVVTPALPADAPLWAHLVIWGVPQVIALIVYIVPNRAK